MRVRDRAFQQLFSRLFVYNILFEDAEVDERYLGLNETSSVLGITGAGCGVAGMVSARPRRIDAVDINPHHLALTALKCTATQWLRPYSSFYDLFGRGWQADPAATVSSLVGHLPSWMQKYWKKHHRVFGRTIHHEGLTAQVIHGLRRLTGVDGGWLRHMISQPVEVRLQVIDEQIVPVLRRPEIATFLRSPLQLVALGINFSQRDRLLETEGTDLVDYFVDHLKRLATTDLETNWFVWYFTAGQYNHDHPDAVPPYLRRDRYDRSLHAPTTVSYHRRSIFDVLDEAGPRTWSHYTLCDAVDWMPPSTQRSLFESILRTSRDGAIVLYRSVEDETVVERLGLDRHFQLLPVTGPASEADRSRQYRRVNFYQVCH